MKVALLSFKRSLFMAVAATGCMASPPGSLGESAASLDEVPTPAAQTFTPLNNAAPFEPDLAQVLTDGRVLAQGYSTNSWYTLTPDNTGSYLNGTWTTVASGPAGYAPLFYASAVLPDGRFFTGGGEYNSGDSVWTTLAAIYDPVKNSWAPVTAPSGWQYIGDAQSLVLADGRYMVADCCETLAAFLNPTTLTWTATGTGKEDVYDEEGWTLLPNGQVITTDASNVAKPMESEIFTPTTGAWSSDGSVGVQLADNVPNREGPNTPASEELGPAVLRPDGTVIATGALGHNAVFDSSTNTWSAAPDFPTVAAGQLDCADAPAALLPNGNVLIATSPVVFGQGAVFFEWDGSKFNKLTAAPVDAASTSSYQYNMVVLPTGEIMVTSQTDIEIYEPEPAGDTSAIEPVITAVPVLEDVAGFSDMQVANIRATESSPLPTQIDFLPLMDIYTGRTYTVSGARLNGVSQGAAYGDDAQTSTAFPLVRFTNQATGHVQYARTHDGSNYAIAKTTTGSTHVDIPATIEPGLSKMQVVANGIGSPELLVNVK